MASPVDSLCGLKTPSREIFRNRTFSRGRSAGYRFVASRENAYAYEKARQDRQFLQTDPVGYEDDLNLYQYVNNDPLNGTDPTGTELMIFADDPKFKAQLAEDLNTLTSQPAGAALVREIIASDQLMVIMRGDQNLTFLPNAEAETMAQNGEGTDVGVLFNPDQTTGYRDVQGSNERPGFVGLAHELGHGRAAMSGQENPSNPEEAAMRTENAVRAEHDLPPLAPDQVPLREEWDR